MAAYIIREGDRLDTLIERTYGAADDAALLTVALANQATWDGGLPEVGTAIELPDALRTDITRIPSPFAPSSLSAPSTGDQSADWRTGGYISNSDAVRQAILTRALTISGSRPYSVDFGSQAVPIGLRASGEGDYPAITATLEAALAKDADWYSLSGIAFARDGETLRVTISATIISDGTPVSAEIGLG